MAYQISEKEIEEANQHMENWINEVSPLEGDDDIENFFGDLSAIGDQVLEKDEQNESDEQDNAQLLEKDEKNESCPEDKEKENSSQNSTPMPFQLQKSPQNSTPSPFQLQKSPQNSTPSPFQSRNSSQNSTPSPSDNKKNDLGIVKGKRDMLAFAARFDRRDSKSFYFNINKIKERRIKKKKITR